MYEKMNIPWIYPTQHATRLALWIPSLIERGPYVHPDDLLLKLSALKPFSVTMATLSNSFVGSYSTKLPSGLRTLYFDQKSVRFTLSCHGEVKSLKGLNK